MEPIKDQHSSSLGISSQAKKVNKKLKQNLAKCDEEFVKSGKLIMPTSHAKQGDLIEFKGAIISHWGVYVGEGNVIHFTNTENGKTTVLRQCIKDVANKRLCRVNNLLESAQRHGLNTNSTEQIMINAYTRLNKEFKYNVIKKNCEQFATFCRYGKGFSDQADTTDGYRTIRTAATIFATFKLKVMASVAKSSTNTRKE